MKNFVIDASITLAWCFSDERTPATAALLERMKSEIAFAPAIWSLEIGNILIQAERRQRINYADMMEFLALINNLNIQIDTATSAKALQETLSLARSETLTTYDAAYLELAMRMGLPLATKDLQLQQAARKLGVTIIS